jgi:NTE family protein
MTTAAQPPSAPARVPTLPSMPAQTLRPPVRSAPPSRTSSVGLVLAGGSARGAYEVGVVRYILEDVARALGRDVPIDVISGTSAGSLNACILAAHADRPSERAAILARQWSNLELEDVVRPAPGEILHVAARMLGRGAKPRSGERRRGGVLDPGGIERIVRSQTPFGAIATHLRAGRLSALSISTTHVASGRTVVFVQRGEAGLPRWGSDPTMIARTAEIRAEHALASAAVPLLFPAVEIDGQYYCDGGLRQNVPLSPARRLGADGLIVINPRYIREETPSPALADARERDYPDPLFVFGKAMNALLLDRIENDIRRLEKLNSVVAAGERRFGPGFGAALNEELGRGGESALRPLDVVYIRASQDIGVLASDYVKSAEFASRIRGLVGRGVRAIGEAETEADLLSYVLFDGPFSDMLIELGHADARARHDELVAFFGKRLEGR